MNARGFIVAALAMLALVGALVVRSPAAGAPAAALGACGIAALNGIGAALVNRQAIGRGMRQFVLWTGIGHGTRVGLLLLAIGAALWSDWPHANLFAASILIGYFCFLAAEIAALHRHAR